MQLFRLSSSRARGKEEILCINSCKSIELLAPSCKYQQLPGPKRNYSSFSFNRPNCGVLWSKFLPCACSGFSRCSGKAGRAVSRVWVTFALWGRGGAESLPVVGGKWEVNLPLSKQPTSNGSVGVWLCSSPPAETHPRVIPVPYTELVQLFLWCHRRVLLWQAFKSTFQSSEFIIL